MLYECSLLSINTSFCIP